MDEPVDVQDIISVLPEGHGVLITGDQSDDRLKASLIKPDKLRELNLLSGVMHIITVGIRPRAGEFINELEMTQYSPATPDNDKFTVHVIKWHGLEWWVATIPAHRIGGADDLAKKYGFKLRRTIPVIWHGLGAVLASMSKERAHEVPEGADWFPIRENTCTVEK